MTKRILTAALETGDLPAAVAALDQDVVLHYPILANSTWPSSHLHLSRHYSLLLALQLKARMERLATPV
jgi:hypothetical protein